MARGDLLRRDPEFPTGLLILGIIVLVLAVVFGLTVWASGSWVIGLVVTVVAGIVLAMCM